MSLLYKQLEGQQDIFLAKRFFMLTRLLAQCKGAIEETNRRRKVQEDFNKEHSITPKGIKKSVLDIMEGARSTRKRGRAKNNKKVLEYL